MGTFPHDTLLTLHLRLTLTQTCHSVKLWAQESERQSGEMGGFCCNGKSSANSKLWIQSLCLWVKLDLMALFRETRPARMYTRTASAPKNTNRWSSLPQTESCQGMPLNICQKVLKQSLVIIYGSLLWSLIADARSGHLRLIFSARLPAFHQKRQVVTHVPKMFYRCFSFFFFF